MIPYNWHRHIVESFRSEWQEKLRAIRAKYPGGVTYQDEARARVTGAYLVFPDFGYWHAVLVCAETGRVLRDDNCLWVRKQARIYEIPIIREVVVIWS